MPGRAAGVRTRSRLSSLTPTWAEGRPAVGLSPLSPRQAGRGEGGEGVCQVSQLAPSAQRFSFVVAQVAIGMEDSERRLADGAWGDYDSCGMEACAR